MVKKLTVRHLLPVAMLILAGALAVLVARNYRGPSPEEIVESLPRDVDLALQEVRYTETRDGIPQWTLVADSAAHSLGEGTTRIENIQMTFFAVEGLGDLTLTAHQGELRTEDREVSVQGDVVVKSPKGYEVHTDRLRYREADRTARTDAGVRIVSDAMEVTGTGMRLDVGSQSVSLLSKVRARIDLAARQPG